MGAKKRHAPDDGLTYLIPERAIGLTEKVLLEYGRLLPSHEGLVYWAGRREGEVATVTTVIAPKVSSGPGRAATSARANFDVVRTLSDSGLTQIAQVHSHPGRWSDHSEGDDRLTAFRVNGLVSIVVPHYCRAGMHPLTTCGIHRYGAGTFLRLSDAYVRKHFRVLAGSDARLKDLRGL